MPGLDLWSKGVNDIILPHFVQVQSGRPRKVRRRELDELDLSYKVSRRGYVVRYENCFVKGHNAHSCPQTENPNKKKNCLRKLRRAYRVGMQVLDLQVSLWYVNYV